MTAVLRVWPLPSGDLPRSLERTDLYDLYAYPPAGPKPSIRMHLVSSSNGAGTVEGLSGGFSSPGDMVMFGALRELSDVILVGAGTVRTERYRGARAGAALQARRVARGQTPVAPIAIVTGEADLDPDLPVFQDTIVPPIVLTVESAPANRLKRIAATGAEVIIVGGAVVDVPLLLEALAHRSLHRVLCEGGPRLFGHLLADDAVDEMCLTLTPTLVGGGTAMSMGPATGLLHLRLMSMLLSEDALFLRYVRDRSPSPENPPGRPPRKVSTMPGPAQP